MQTVHAQRRCRCERRSHTHHVLERERKDAVTKHGEMAEAVAAQIAVLLSP